jgi:hypothetical protein
MRHNLTYNDGEPPKTYIRNMWDGNLELGQVSTVFGIEIDTENSLDEMP